jgi:catechol 2,3-dioxygenase-like lactoylglutathione lyase family enzyme
VVLRDGPESDERPDVRMTVIHVGPSAELNVFQVKGNTEAEHQTPMFGRGRLDHLALQAASLEAFETIRDRLMARGAADDFVTDFGSILSVFFRDPDGLECEICVKNPDAKPGVGNPPGTRAARYS